MNSRPKQKPLRDRTIAGIREGAGVSNSISSKSPGFSRIPAYSTIPPSLISVPRPSTTVVEKPFEVTTRTGISTGRRGQRREFSVSGIMTIIILAVVAVQITKVKWACVRGDRGTDGKICDRGRQARSRSCRVLYNLPVNRRRKLCLAAVFVLWLGIFQIARMQAESVSQLKPTGYINDYAHVLNPSTVAQINDICLQIDQKAHAQITLVTINSLDGADIDSYAVDLFKKWGVGSKSTDRGVLILYAIQDHRARIEVGYGLEPILPDGKVGSFQREATPLMRSGNYNDALLLVTSRVAEVIATDAGIQLTNSQPRAPTQPEPQPSGGLSVGGIIGIVIVVLIILFTPLRSILF